MTNNTPKLNRWSWGHSIAVFAIPAILIAAMVSVDNKHTTNLWIVAIVLLLLLVWLAGYAITGRFLGLLIDKRNKMSLSRFQAATWTILVLATLMTGVYYNLEIIGWSAAADIAIPGEILGLIGISAAALVGSPLLLSARDQKTVVNKPERMKTSAANALVKKANANSEELTPIHKNAEIGKASVADMFTGDEIDNSDYLDLAKVQNFLFNLIVISLYGSGVYTMLSVLEVIDPTLAKNALDAAAAAVQSNLQALDEATRSAAAAMSELDKLPTDASEEVVNAAKALVESSNATVSELTTALAQAREAQDETTSKYLFSSFPEISGGLLSLLGISTGGYLAHKGVAHTPTEGD